MSRRPRVAARWRFEFERPTRVLSGLWRRVGWDFRMRVTRRTSFVRMARRRRMDGSIMVGDGS